MQELSQIADEDGNVFRLPLTFFGENTEEGDNSVNVAKASLNITYNKEHIFIGTDKRDRTDDVLFWSENNGKINVIFKNEQNKTYTYTDNTKIEIVHPFFDKDIKQSHLYIGVKAGEKISDEINKAKESIKILSPFLGEKQIDQLINIKNKKQNINIKVISTDSDDNFNNPKNSSSLKKIIYQEPPRIYEKNKYVFDLLKNIIKFYIILYPLTLFTLVFLQFRGINSILFQYKYIIFLLLLVIPILYKCHKSIKVFYYEYNTVFHIIFVKKYNKKIKNKESIYLHSKIFIIDDKIAFLGSINFTSSAFFYNFETCLTIDDEETVINLSKSFDELYQIGLPKIDINELGKKMYNEPIN